MNAPEVGVLLLSHTLHTVVGRYRVVRRSVLAVSDLVVAPHLGISLTRSYDVRLT